MCLLFHVFTECWFVLIFLSVVLKVSCESVVGGSCCFCSVSSCVFMLEMTALQLPVGNDLKTWWPRFHYHHRCLKYLLPISEVCWGCFFFSEIGSMTLDFTGHSEAVAPIYSPVPLDVSDHLLVLQQLSASIGDQPRKCESARWLAAWCSLRSLRKLQFYHLLPMKRLIVWRD